MYKVYKVVEISEAINAIVFDNKKDIRIQVCYPKNNAIREMEAEKDFWKEYERLSANSRLINSSI